MLLVVIFVAGPVRHMPVRAGSRMGETTDKHGQRPCRAPGPGRGRRLARAVDDPPACTSHGPGRETAAQRRIRRRPRVNTAAGRDGLTPGTGHGAARGVDPRPWPHGYMQNAYLACG